MHVETLIIGSNPAATRTALTAATNGTETLLITNTTNQCTERSCAHIRALHTATKLLQQTTHTPPGVTMKPRTNFRTLMQGLHKQTISEQQRLRSIRHERLRVLMGEAHFVAKNTVEHDNTRITADHIIISTGTRPRIPPIPGIEDTPYLTCDNVLTLKEQPQHLIILGGGRTGIEVATAFTTLGTKVTVIERSETIVSWLDKDVRSQLLASLQQRGVRFITGSHATGVHYQEKTFRLKLGGGTVSSVSGDALLIASGRVPNTEPLNLAAAGVRVDEQGRIEVDDWLRTSNTAVYAIGDVNGKGLSLSAARKEGWLALENILLGTRARMQYKALPWSLLTDPVVAGFGLSASELQEKGLLYEVLETPRKASEERDFVRVCHHEGRLLGALVVGPSAEDVVHELVAYRACGTEAVRQLQQALHIDDSPAEWLESLRAQK